MDLECEECSNPATVKLMATDLDGKLLDERHSCGACAKDLGFQLGRRRATFLPKPTCTCSDALRKKAPGYHSSSCPVIGGDGE